MQLNGSTLNRIEIGEDECTLFLDPLQVVRSMAGAYQDTLWSQSGWIRLQRLSAPVAPDDLNLPAKIATGDVEINVYTLRDQVQCPVEGQGAVACELSFTDGRRLRIEAEEIHSGLEGDGKYLRHLDAR